jgi:hypothetical protein
LLGLGIRYRYLPGDDVPFDSTLYARGKIIKNYVALDPRLALTFKIKTNSLVMSYDRTRQFLHLLTNASIGLPTDMWMPSGANIKPQVADIYAARFTRMHPSTGIEWNLSTYWKKMYNTVDFKDNANLFVNKYIESQVAQGSGKGYGVEAMAQKKNTMWEASISYTWSKVFYHIPDINQGKRFSTRYDKRHNFTARGVIYWSARWETGLNFVFTSGGALTVPTGNFLFGTGAANSSAFNYYTERNGYRLPAYHRMDFSVKYNQRKNEIRKWKGTWSVDVYNLYGKKNPFLFYSLQKDHDFRYMSFNLPANYLSLC